MPSKKNINSQKLIKKRKAEKLKVKLGDNVVMLCGDDKKKTGKIIKIIKKRMKIIVEGVNKHKKIVMNEDKTKGFVEVELPVHISNVKKVD